MSIGIRAATPADYPDIARIVSAVNSQRPVSAETLARGVRALLDSPLKPHLHEWVAEQRGEVVAQAVVSQSPGMFHPDRYEAEVIVLPQARGQGIGTQLAQVIEAHLRARGAQEILAGTYDSGPVPLRFLSSRGFSEVMRFFDNVLNLSGFNLPTGNRKCSCHRA